MASAADNEQQLRQALADAGAEWLVEQVDLAVAEGHAVVRQKAGGETLFVGGLDRKDGEITASPYTAPERLELLLAAVRRTLLAAPQLVDEVNALVARDADTITFVNPATDEQARVLPSEANVRAARAAATELAELLNSFDIEAES